MILYNAGNFPQMGDPEEERKMMNIVLDKYPYYNRLVSFFYKKEAENVIGVMNERSQSESD